MLGKTKTILPQVEQFTCLRIGFANNHRSNSIIILLQSESAEVGNDIVEQRIQITFVLNDFIAVNVALLHFNTPSQLVENAFDFSL